MKKVLIIEDEIDLLEDLSEILMYEGFEPYKAKNGEEGYELAITISPDIILCDILMPGIDGFELLQKLNNSEQKPDIPFIFTTALSDRTNLRKGMEYGADDYLTKPFTKEELLNAIKSRLTRHDQLTRLLRVENNEMVKELLERLDGLNHKLVAKGEELFEISELHNDLRRELQEKEQELLNKDLSVLEFNSTIQQLRKLIKQYMADAKLAPELKTVLLELNSTISKNSLLSSSLTAFQFNFNQQYPNFSANIGAQYPQLTQYDLTLISAMAAGLNTFQLADMLCISPDSVRKSRYRIKKKLELTPDQNLLGFICEFK
ncbi:response regulator [Draconibacterium orientale]|uniref:response regulator n=1 Tax=Draconibacterium orientale TaxID=1168034 RepID=UPI0029C02FB8|nr:response regulator [Draconibacterium orientale]